MEKVTIYDNTLNFAITNFFSFSEQYLQNLGYCHLFTSNNSFV